MIVALPCFPKHLKAFRESSVEFTFILSEDEAVNTIRLLNKQQNTFKRKLMQKITFMRFFDMRKCSGNNFEEWGVEAIFDIECPNCGHLVQFF